MRPLMKNRLRAAVSASLCLALAAGGLAAVEPPASAADAHQGSSSSAPHHLSAQQASAKAKASGKPVVADALTTAFQQTTANPDGTYTLTESAAPSRVYRGGTWVPLDPTLHVNPDGTISPAATTSALTLSGGGSGPLATLTTGGQQFTLTLPLALPKPALSGDTATYTQVIPGVDLTVTVTPTGAFSDVFELHDATAAADPRLASLLSATIGLSRGLTQNADTAGNITVTEHGHAVVTAAAPYGWDSATTATSGPQGNDLASPATSSTNGPGRAAHIARLTVHSTSGHLALSAPSGITGAAATYPVFLDPTYSPSYGANAWASFGSDSSVAGTQEYNKSTDPTGDAFIGLGSNVGNVWSAFNFKLPDTGTSSANNLVDAHIYSATFGITAITSGGYCNTDPTNEVDLYAPDPTGGNYLTSTHADYDYWSGRVGSVLAKANFDGAQTCSNSGAGGFTVTSAVSAEVSTHKTGNQTFVLAAEDHSDYLGTKRFVYAAGTAGNPVLTVTYDKNPGTPSNPTISVGDGCGSTVGDTGLSLLVQTNDVMPFQLTTTFDLYEDGDASKTNQLTTTTATANGVNSDAVQTGAGQPAVLTLPGQFFKALSPTSPLTFDWTATSSDGQLSSPAPSTLCSFTYDPTRPGPATITPAPNNNGTTCATEESSGGTTPAVGATCSFTLAPPAGATVSGYTYQLNQQSPVTVAVTADAQNYTLTVTVPQIINTLTVNGLSAGGNIGAASTVHFDGSKLSPPAVDGSVTDDGEPDMIIAGGAGNLPDGLWLAQASHDGALSTDTNIGLAGLGYSNTGANPAADWHGASVITGDFCGLGAQDIMAYYPAGTHSGGSAVACSTGAETQLTSGNPLSNSTGDQVNSSGTFSDGNGDNATQIANAYNTSGISTGEPDLFATIDGQLYLFTSTSPNTYSNSDGFALCDQGCDILSALNPPNAPDGTATNWSDWTITTARDGASTDMYLWDPTTGALDLWTGIAADTTDGTAYPNFTKLTYTAYTGTAPWSSGTTNLILRAGTLNPTDPAPALWAMDPSTGHVTAYTPGTSSGALTLTAAATSTMNGFAHSWQFTDMPSGKSGSALGSTADTASAGLALTGSASDVTWHTGDIYSPDALLNTASDGQTPVSSPAGDLKAGGPAVTVNAPFTVSAAVRPNAAGGIILSQDGTNTAGFTLGSTSAGQWQFCMARSDASTPTLDCATGGAVNVGLWSVLTATYDPSMGIMRLYVDGNETGVTGHAKASGTVFTGDFEVGDARTGSTAGSFYSGQIADIDTRNAVMPPSQHITTGSDFVPLTPTRILDTRSTSKIGNITGPVASDSTSTVAIAGTTIGGQTLPSTGVTAVAISITETNASTIGLLTVYPDGTAQPFTSTLNYGATSSFTNNAITPVGTDGKIAIYNNSSGTAQIIIDVTGYYTTATSTNNASTYVPLRESTRILDTRSSSPLGVTSPAPIAVKGTLTLQIAGNITNSADIPTDSSGAQITGVAITLTAVDSAGGGQLITYADGTGTPPNTSNLNYSPGAIVASTVVVPVGTDGKIDIYNQGTAPVDVIGDVTGYYTTATTGEHYYTAGSDRLLDTRIYNPQTQSASPVAGKTTLTLPTPAGIPASNPTLVLNITVTNPTAAGTLSTGPANLTAPTGTALNWASGQTIADLSVTTSSDGGGINFYNNSSGTFNLVLDTNGYFN